MAPIAEDLSVRVATARRTGIQQRAEDHRVDDASALVALFCHRCSIASKNASHSSSVISERSSSSFDGTGRARASASSGSSRTTRGSSGCFATDMTSAYVAASADPWRSPMAGLSAIVPGVEPTRATTHSCAASLRVPAAQGHHHATEASDTELQRQLVQTQRSRARRAGVELGLHHESDRDAARNSVPADSLSVDTQAWRWESSDAAGPPLRRPAARAGRLSQTRSWSAWNHPSGGPQEGPPRLASD